MEKEVQLHARVGHADGEGVLGHVDGEGVRQAERDRGGRTVGGEGSRPRSGCRAW